MRTIHEVMKEKGNRLESFKSPLSRPWETLVFAVIDTLHNLEREGFMKTLDIKAQLLPMIAEGRYDADAVRTAIRMIEGRTTDTPDRLVKKQINEALDLLNAVVNTLG